MDRPTIKDENLRRRQIWNNVDNKAYAGTILVDSSTAQKKAERERLERDVKLFLARGGKIEQVNEEETGYEPGKQSFVIKARTNSNAT